MRSEPVTALKSDGCDHGWLFRFSRGSGTAGSRLPSRLKPTWLGSARIGSRPAYGLVYHGASPDPLAPPNRRISPWIIMVTPIEAISSVTGRAPRARKGA